jgi:predicted aspartyl protease
MDCRISGEVARMRGRRLRLLSLLICISIAGSLSAAAKEHTDQASSIKGAVRFDLYRGYLMVAKGSVGQLKGLHFLLDTGTSTTLLDPRIAHKLNVAETPEDVNIMFFKGGVRAMHAHVPSIELGPLRKMQVPVLVEDLSIFDNALPVHIDGVIGLDVMGTTRFEVDYRHRRIYFGQLPRLPISIPLSNEDGLAMVNVEVNHTAAHLIFDTGTPALLLFAARIPRAIMGLKVHRAQSNANTQGAVERKEVHLPRLRLGEAEFTRQLAFVVESRDEGGRDFDGLLSPAALGIDAFAVDLERGALELRLGM